jgi:hypothetical protein
VRLRGLKRGYRVREGVSVERARPWIGDPDGYSAYDVRLEDGRYLMVYKSLPGLWLSEQAAGRVPQVRRLDAGSKPRSKPEHRAQRRGRARLPLSRLR